jgi:hypothetical protein
MYGWCVAMLRMTTKTLDIFSSLHRSLGPTNIANSHRPPWPKKKDDPHGKYVKNLNDVTSYTYMLNTTNKTLAMKLVLRFSFLVNSFHLTWNRENLIQFPCNDSEKKGLSLPMVITVRSIIRSMNLRFFHCKWSSSPLILQSSYNIFELQEIFNYLITRGRQAKSES